MGLDGSESNAHKDRRFLRSASLGTEAKPDTPRLDHRRVSLAYDFPLSNFDPIAPPNKPFKQWASIFSNDSSIASAVLDRLLHHAETVIIEGPSYRMKDRDNPVS